MVKKIRPKRGAYLKGLENAKYLYRGDRIDIIDGKEEIIFTDNVYAYHFYNTPLESINYNTRDVLNISLSGTIKSHGTITKFE